MKASLIISVLLLSLFAGPGVEKARAANVWLNPSAATGAGAVARQLWRASLRKGRHSAARDLVPEPSITVGLLPRRCSPRYRSRAALSTHWPEDALVNVYFVRDMFSAAERHTLQEAMEDWTSRAGTRDVRISFLFAGETGGLIDCERCLTITRQGLSSKAERATLKVLRQDEKGRLLSAWIAVERVAASPATLRNQLLQALEQGLEVNGSRTASNQR